MLTIDDSHVIDCMSAENPPAATCADGETVLFITRDCYDNGVTSPDRPDGDRQNRLANPSTGPLFVEGAECGDVLKVEILSIKLRDWGVMRTSPTAGAFHHLYDHRTARIFDLTDGRVRLGDGVLDEPTDTMIGVIGTAPSGEGIDTETPDLHGGNMDCNRIVEGCTVYLPVSVPGALLALGDLHARMGNGETMICGLETAGEVTVRVSVLKNCVVPTPFVVDGDSIMTVQSAPTLDQASLIAAQKMHSFVKDATGKDDVDAGMLMSLVADLVICQIVDPQMTVRAEFPLHILRQYGYEIP